VTARFWIVIAFLIATLAGGLLVAPRLEGEPPAIAELPGLEVGREPRPLTVEVSDEGSGLRSVELRVLSAGGARTLAERQFPGSLVGGGDARSERIEISLDAGELGLPDGPATLVVVARDWSMRAGFSGNGSERSTSLTVDTKPPLLRVQSGLTYVYRGGSAAVLYSLGESTPQDGVRVGDVFFQGHPLDPADPASLDRIAIFAIPVSAPANPDVRIVAQDGAGNRSAVSFALRIFDREFGDSSIELSPSFLDGVVRPLAESNGLAGRDLRETFKNVNEVLRGRNEARIREAVAESRSERRWQGAFEQQRGSQVTSRFAEKRTYFLDSEPISEAVHYGFDLASTSGVEVTAANDGVVVFAGDLGIYGQCIIVDHGLGVHTLYAHLAQLDVAEGDAISKGQTLGRSGATGLAGGDHLHFAVLVGGEYVDPLEWWDPKWVRSHVEEQLLAPRTPPG
jgi:murein DD-endopeptidase MepM/ murein hydrolase activator NlpD